MNYMKQIDIFIKNNKGIVTSAMLTKSGIPRYYLTNLTKSGYLEKINRGIYVKSDMLEDEMYVLQSKYSKGIFSCETALYILGFTDRTPAIYSMTFKQGYHCESLKNENIKHRTIIDKFYDLGVIEARSPFGNTIRVYNIERTLCDIVKETSNCDIQIVNEAMKRYVKSKKKNISLLMEYAEKLRVKKKILNYMEVLL